MHCRLLILDLDGTLTEPLLDFSAIRRDMGIAAGEPILEALAAMPADQRKAATAVLLQHERDAAVRSTLNPGCRELLDWCETNAMPMVVLTRNSRASAERVFAAHGLCVPHLVCRDDAPPKPDPAAIVFAAARVSDEPIGPHVWMVGDGRHDIEAASAAAVTGVWLSLGRVRDFDALPDWIVPSLDELLAMLER